jgi:hypothetical protein
LKLRQTKMLRIWYEHWFVPYLVFLLKKLGRSNLSPHWPTWNWKQVLLCKKWTTNIIISCTSQSTKNEKLSRTCNISIIEADLQVPVEQLSALISTSPLDPTIVALVSFFQLMNLLFWKLETISLSHRWEHSQYINKPADKRTLLNLAWIYVITHLNQYVSHII